MSLISHIHRPFPRAWPLLVAQLGLLAILLGMTGCGYRMEQRGLPEQATSLGIGSIKNLTYTGELDVRLRHELRRKLLANPAFALISPERSQLILEVDLNRADFVRALSVSNTDISSLRIDLVGVVNLRRPRQKIPVIANAVIRASATLNFDSSVIESAAVRDEIENDVIVAFVKKVETLLYLHF